jgi:hypothetical protein
MLDDAQDSGLIHQVAMRHSVDPEVIGKLLALGPKFENFNLYGAKVQLTRAVEQILDEVADPKSIGAKR